MDLLLDEEQIVIETKMTRIGTSQKKIKEETIVDKSNYKGHKHCKNLYCFVYDPSNRIRNPRGFEKDLSNRVNGFETKVFVYPF
jgi:alpha-L-arabinofuranosidase